MVDRTVEEIVLPLAEGMVLHCSLCRGGEEHPVCNGTGEVPEFPTLRRPCPQCKGRGSYEVGGPVLKYVNLKVLREPDNKETFDFLVECERCQGRGWLPVTTTDALLEAILSLGFQPRIRKHLSQFEICLYQGGSFTPWGDGGDAQDTLAGALALALEAVIVVGPAQGAASA